MLFLSDGEDGLDFINLYNHTLCAEDSGDKLVRCIQSVNEDFINSSIDSYHEKPIETYPFYMYNTFGYSLKLPALNEWEEDRFELYLNPKISYAIDITDTKLQLTLGKPGIIPRTMTYNIVSCR